MAPLLLLLAAGFLHTLTATKTTPQPELCIDKKRECEQDLTCSFASTKFKKECPHIEGTRMMDYVSNAQTTSPGNCSSACVKAIEKLKGTKKGSGLYNCDCQLDGDCLTLKSRVGKCLMVDDAWRRRMSCTMARLNCSRNSHCNKLQSNFLRACNHMINGVECEEKCMKAQTKLLANEHGKYSFDCECDGINEAYCRAIHAHAKQLRCLPGMDGSGTPVFEYHHTDIIHGEDIAGNSSCASLHLYVLPWTLVLLLLLVM